MRHDLISIIRPVCIAGAIATLGLPPAFADSTEATQNAPAATQLAPAVPSVLQVTGTTNRFNVSASHADVQSVLKAIFEQSHLQFVPDTSVNGEVTLVLTGQTFSVVLASVCKQTFLRYNVDKNGIYQFTRNDQALSEEFARMRAINGVIADQLRRMGYQLLPTGQAGTGNGAYYLQGAPGGQAGGFSGGGRVGGGTGGSGLGSRGYGRGAAAPRDRNGADGTVGDAGPEGPAMAKRSTPGSVQSDTKSQGGTGTVSGPQGPAGPDLRGSQSRVVPAPDAAQNRSIQNQPALDQGQETLSPYDQLLRDNGLVGVHVPKEEPLPIAEVLKRFGRQANVPVLIDPQIQNDRMLKFYGNIVRPLPDALNLLLPTAHLEWRFSGGAIFVTQAPDFGIFYGISNIPKAVFPANGLLQLPSTRGQAPQRSAAPKSEPTPNKDKTDGKDSE
jgi:hypothetical protein